MTNDKGVRAQITQRLTEYLNKPVSESFTSKIIDTYEENNSLSHFLIITKALGFPLKNDFELGKEIYKLINDNISKLRSTNDTATTLNCAVNIPKDNGHNEQKLNRKLFKKPRVSLSFFGEGDLDLIEQGEKVSDDETQASQGLGSLKRDAEVTEAEDTDGRNGADRLNKFGVGRKKFKFKKISKEKASRLKQEGAEEETPHKTLLSSQTRNNEVKLTPENGRRPQTLAELAANEELNFETKSTIEFEADVSDEEDLENDREWYMIDEAGHVFDQQQDTYDLEEAEKQLVKRSTAKKSPTSRHEDTGGSYNMETGEYTDFDHLQSNADDLSRIPISSHFIVPPFLASYKEDLYLKIQKGFQTAGTTNAASKISPVKDPDSELAILARKGSTVVKEWKSSKEKALQAKERSGLKGTTLGKILEVDGEDTEQDNNDIVEDQGKAQEKVYSKMKSTLELEKERRSLPAFAVKSSLLKMISENQVSIIIGETGSGKTTQLTQFLFEAGFGGNLGKEGSVRMIGCTQPRRVAAMSVAKRVSEEQNCKLGEEVGYSIRFEDKTDKKKTVIKYMTEGVLLREILVDPFLENYSCIIMDEAHERSLSTDILLGLFKMLCTKRRDLKIIITSATMNAGKFAEYFGEAPQFTIPGRTFPVEVFYSRSTNADYVETAVRQVLTIHLQQFSKHRKNDGDILVFMTGQDDIEVTSELIKEKLSMLEDVPVLDVYPIYSSMPAELQTRIFRSMDPMRRKVVVATNIAETSLTVDGVKYVIDTGLAKLKVYNPKLGMDSLQVVPVSMANANQRSGRAGRTGPGVAYRLYTEKSYEKNMYVQPIPEIQRSNLSNVLLLLKSLKVNDLAKFPFIDPPPGDLLHCSLYDLWGMGAIDNLGDLTDLGSDMSKFPMEPSLSKLILLSCAGKFHCSNEMITIVSMLSVPSVFYRPKERADEADLIREKYLIAESDHLTLLNVYNQWEQQLHKRNASMGSVSTWCSKNFFHKKSLFRAREIRNQLKLILMKNKLPLLKCQDDATMRKCICAGFYQQLAKLVRSNFGSSAGAEYFNIRNKFMKMYLHPTSALNTGSNLAPLYVVYHELILTTKEYMSCVTSVEPIWLLEFGYMFYEVPSRFQEMIQQQTDVKVKSLSEIETMIKVDRIELENRIKKDTKKSKPVTLKQLDPKNKPFSRKGL